MAHAAANRDPVTGRLDHLRSGKPVSHGLVRGYGAGCRCGECCVANTESMRAYAKKRRDSGNPCRRPSIEIVCAHCGTTATVPKKARNRPGRNKYCSRECCAAANLMKAQSRFPEWVDEQRELEPFTITICWGGCSKIVAAGKGKDCPDRRYCDDCLVRQALDNRSPLRAAVEDRNYAIVVDLVFEQVTVDDSGCWIWPKVDGNKYPVFGWAKAKSLRPGTPRVVHRAVLEAKHGKPLGSQHAHHVCANSMCVNPDHLQPVTHRENMAEMLARHSYLKRIKELEAALRSVAPDHLLLSAVEYR